jgi:hypothetical protein
LWKSNFAEVEFPQYNLLVSKGIELLEEFNFGIQAEITGLADGMQ